MTGPPDHIGVYKVGDCYVNLHEDRYGYCGSVYADPSTDPSDRVSWHFDHLRGPAIGVHDERSLAISVCSFGGYYTSDNRGDDLPDWAPEPDIADAINNASAWVEDPAQVEELTFLPEWCFNMEENNDE